MEELLAALHWYGGVVHPPLVLVLCIAGSMGHLFTMTTLQTMVNPTNALLMSMSCSQLLLCANFLYATLFKWASDEMCITFTFSQWMARTMHLSVTLSVLLHMAGVFHVVALSIVRYFSLKKLSAANSNVPWFSYNICRVIIVVIYSSVLVISIPLFFTSHVAKHPEKSDCVSRFPALKGTQSYELTYTTNHLLQQFNFWLFNLCAKIGPSVVLCVMTRLIVRELQKIRVMSARFASSERDKQHHRTTMMILTIMFMFIVVELPQGILALISTISEGAMKLQHALGDINEMITLMTSCVIFSLFCSTSGKVRSALMDTPCIRFMRSADKKIATSMSIRRVPQKDKQLIEVPTPVDRSNNYVEV